MTSVLWRIALTMGASLLLLAACSTGGGDNAPIPRPEAYPRAQLYPAEYVSRNLAPDAAVEVNRYAEFKVSRSDGNIIWFTIRYPLYSGMEVECTLQRRLNRRELLEALDNRATRMALNSGGAPGELTRITSATYATVLTTPGVLTPVQFLATDSAEYLLSGTAVMPRIFPSDSIAPVLRAVEADVIHMLQEMRNENGEMRNENRERRTENGEQRTENREL
jgi:hypothetical protein